MSLGGWSCMNQFFFGWIDRGGEHWQWRRSWQMGGLSVLVKLGLAVLSLSVFSWENFEQGIPGHKRRRSLQQWQQPGAANSEQIDSAAAAATAAAAAPSLDSRRVLALVLWCNHGVQPKMLPCILDLCWTDIFQPVGNARVCVPWAACVSQTWKRSVKCIFWQCCLAFNPHLREAGPLCGLHPWVELGVEYLEFLTMESPCDLVQ